MLERAFIEFRYPQEIAEKIDRTEMMASYLLKPLRWAFGRQITLNIDQEPLGFIESPQVSKIARVFAAFVAGLLFPITLAGIALVYLSETHKAMYQTYTSFEKLASMDPFFSQFIGNIKFA